MKVAKSFAALIIGITFAASAAIADESSTTNVSVDIDAGKSTYKKSCRRCHGPTAKGMASFPKLVGQSTEFLVERLESYRAGDKVGPNTALMAPNAKDLTDQDILNISHFIISLQ